MRVVRRGDGMQMWRPSPASCTVTSVDVVHARQDAQKDGGRR